MTRRFLGVNQRGETNVLVVPLILATLLLIGAIAFGAWSFSSREDYRLNVEKKIAAAVKIAKQEEGIAKDKEHAEADKQPLRTYKGPEPYGSVRVMYPKTWSAYVVEAASGNEPLDGYFHPSVVPGVSEKSAAYALRVQVVNTSYTRIIASLNNDVTSKKLTATPYAFPLVPKTTGVRFEGQITDDKNIKGSMVIVPLRDKTLKVWIESPLYAPDFNNYILPNITFVP